MEDPVIDTTDCPQLLENEVEHCLVVLFPCGRPIIKGGKGTAYHLSSPNANAAFLQNPTELLTSLLILLRVNLRNANQN